MSECGDTTETTSFCYQDFSPHTLQALGQKNITMNMHQSGIPPAAFTENPTLASFYDLLATNQAACASAQTICVVC